MRSSSRGAERAGRDNLDWIEGVPRRTRTGSDRRADDGRADDRRRASGRAPADERRARERRSDERRGTSARAQTARREPDRRSDRRADPERAAAPKPARRRDRHATPAVAVLGPGVAERRALLLVTFLLVVYGLVMAYSASSAEAYFEHHPSYYFFGKQLVWVVIGVVAMLGLSRVDYAWFRKMAFPIAGLAAAGLLLVLVPGVGSVVNGARRWIVFGGQSFQPSEAAKIAAVILVAALIVRRPWEVATFKGFAKLVMIGILPAAALIMKEPDLGTTLVLAAAVVAVLIAGGAPLRYLFGLFFAAVFTVLALVVTSPYRLERLVTFFDPWKDAQDSGYQATQSLISIASGRVFGVGLGNSVQKFGFLPEQGTDMITGIIGEELGLVGLLVLLALYAALAWFCFRIALNCKDLFGKLLATGITAIIIGQACINVGAALGLLPLTGVPLPLVSLGGTSMLVVLAGLGVLLNIATNRRSHIGVSAQRRDRAAGSRGDRRSPAAGPRRRG